MKATYWVTMTLAFCSAVNIATADLTFELDGNDRLEVTTRYSEGTLRDSSTARVVEDGYIGRAYVHNDAKMVVAPGGEVFELRAHDSSHADISGGELEWLNTWGSSSVDISDGVLARDGMGRDNSSVTISGGTFQGSLYAWGSSSFVISGGMVWETLWASGSSITTVSGGTIPTLRSQQQSTVKIDGYDFNASAGLSLLEYDVIDGVPQYEVVGEGLLTGKWSDGTSWNTMITQNDGTIYAIPEPGSLSLLALGGLAVLRRRRNR